MSNFKHIPLQIFEPVWGSNLTNVIIQLEKLREKRLGGPVPPYIFFQLKNIFHMFESLGSARIEGNNTTLAELVEKVIDTPNAKDETMKEISNIEKAIDYIEKKVLKNFKFDRAFLSDIHKMLVQGLTPPSGGEGSVYPGQLRPVNVRISGSNHIPPDQLKVPEYFDELIEFVNKQVSPQYHLLVTALSHHRMAWIHPYDNGNGRLIRMFTYAMLIKQGFQVKTGRIINPSAIFCINRDKYYEMLSKADTGEKEGVLAWCQYVLEGLRGEIEKIDKLLDRKYMTEAILLPVLDMALERAYVNQGEYEILKILVKNPSMTVKSADITKVVGQESSVQRSRIIKKLRDRKMLIPVNPNGKVYTIGFLNNYLLRCVALVLEANGFVPKSLNAK